ncbi:MAG TPA: Ig-like domain-containing protein, partial [Kofleriaceae bacterium]
MVRFAILTSLFASACSGEIEGGGSDPIDDPQDPPPPTEVRIKVHDTNGPIAGLPVVFLDANDAVAADIVTDAQGIAVAKLANGSVTIIRAATMSPTAGALYTYVGVKAGDELELALPTAERTTTPVTVKVTVPLTEDGGAVEVRTPCGSGVGAPPIVEVTLDGCGTETDFYVTELGLGEATVSFLKRATIADSIDLSGEMYRAELTTSFSVMNAPADASVSIEKRIETELFRPVFSTGANPVTPGELLELAIPDLPGTEQQVIATVTYQGAAQLVGSREAYAAGPEIVDLAAAMIITPSAPTLAGDAVSWTEQGSGAPDAVLATIQNESVARYVAAPYAGASIKVPRLP